MKRRITAIMSMLLLIGTQVQAQEFESATDAVKNMGVGWNLGNTLDAWAMESFKTPEEQETKWGQPVTTPELMKMMKEAGFTAIRVPVTWFPWTDADGNVKEAWMKRVHEVVDYVIDEGLYCILNVHHDTGEGDQAWLIAEGATYDKTMARYENLWKQIAEEFKDYDQKLLFESYNEMLDKYKSWCFATFNSPTKYVADDAADAYDAINKYAQSFVDVVRKTGGNNAYRNLIVNTYGACCGSGNWNNHLKDPLKELQMPADPVENVSSHLAFEVHTYPNIENLANAKKELDDMISALSTNLMEKGAPVIIGEWGTSNVDKGAGKTDYDLRRDQMFQYVDYFIEQTKAKGMATFYWMGLSDGHYRSMPAFNQADLAERIVKAYHGSDYKGIFPTPTTEEVDYEVKYTGDWQELNLYSGSALKASDYTGVHLILAEPVAEKSLQVKVYGDPNGSTFKEGYYELEAGKTDFVINFDSSKTGSEINRITLQTFIGAQTVTLHDAFLVKSDGTEEKAELSVFWGCTLSTKPRTTGIASVKLTEQHADDAIYSLQGQKVSTPTKGIYIKNGKKYVVK